MNSLSLQEQLETLSIESLKVISEKIDTLIRQKFKAQVADPVEMELTEYFKTHKPGGFRIRKFSLMDDDCDSITIIPREPYIEEEYDDDKADAEIEKIGKKYGVRLGWTCSVYGK